MHHCKCARKLELKFFIYDASDYFQIKKQRCVKSVRIQSYSGPYFPALGLTTERYGVSLRISPNAGK